jgi:putative endonuclease
MRWREREKLNLKKENLQSRIEALQPRNIYFGANPTAASNSFILTITNMFYVYILLSLKDKKRYIGFTENLDRRLSEHYSGLVRSTRNRKPLKLLYFEEFENKSDAMKREKEIKSKKGKFTIPYWSSATLKYLFRGESDRRLSFFYCKTFIRGFSEGVP